MPNLSVVSITQPPADSTFVAQPGKQGFYVKELPGNGSPLTSFSESDNLADNIVGAFPFSSTVEAAELIMLSGKRLRGDRVVTADNQTFRAQVFKGQAKHTLFFDRMISRKDAPYRGQALGFLRTYPDDNAIQGILYVEGMNAEGDPSADAFGYDIEVSFGDFAWVDVRIIPTYSSKTPATGASGTSVAYTGTNLDVVTAVAYKQSGSTVATQSTLTSRSPTGFTAAVPAGLTTGTYNVFLVYAGGEVAAANHTVS